jgi:hypothetical protein
MEIKIVFMCTVTPSPNSVYTYGTRFSSTILIAFWELLHLMVVATQCVANVFYQALPEAG